MREPERDFGRLQDIIQAANHIASFTDGYSQEELKDDKLRFFAVVKNVEIIGEAAYMLSLVFKRHLPRPQPVPHAGMRRLQMVEVVPWQRNAPSRRAGAPHPLQSQEAGKQIEAIHNRNGGLAATVSA